MISCYNHSESVLGLPPVYREEPQYGETLTQLMQLREEIKNLDLPESLLKSAEAAMEGLSIAIANSNVSLEQTVPSAEVLKAIEMEESRQKVTELYEEYKGFKWQFQQDIKEDQDDLDLMRRIIDRGTPPTEDELERLNRSDLTPEQREQRTEERRSRLDTTVEIYNRASELHQYHTDQAKKAGNEEARKKHEKIAEEQKKLVEEVQPELKDSVRQFHELIDLAQDKKNADIVKEGVRKRFGKWQTHVLNDASLLNQNSRVIKALENTGLSDELAKVEEARKHITDDSSSILTSLKDPVPAVKAEEKSKHPVPTPETFGKVDNSSPTVTIPPATPRRGASRKKTVSPENKNPGRDR